MPLGGFGGVGAVAGVKLGRSLHRAIRIASREASRADDGHCVARRVGAQRFKLHHVGKLHTIKQHAVGVLKDFSMGRGRLRQLGSAAYEG